MREPLKEIISTNPNQSCYLLLNWAQCHVYKQDMQLHVTSRSGATPFPFPDKIGYEFVPFNADNFANVHRQ